MSMSLTPEGSFVVGGIGIFSILLGLIKAGMGLYAFVLFVKLAHRGITALDLYIYAKTIGNRKAPDMDDRV